MRSLRYDSKAPVSKESLLSTGLIPVNCSNIRWSLPLVRRADFDVVNVHVLSGLQRTARPPDDLAVLQNTPALRDSHRTRSRNGRWNIGAATTKLTQA